MRTAFLAAVLLAGVSSIEALPVYFLGRVDDDTPASSPVPNATVTMVFTNTSGHMYPDGTPGNEGFSLQTKTNDSGYFVVCAQPKGELAVIMFTDVNLVVSHTRAKDGTVITLPKRVDGIQTTLALDVAGVATALGINPDATGVALGLLAALAKIEVPVLTSTDFAGQVGLGKITVDSCVARQQFGAQQADPCASAVPEPSTADGCLLAAAILAGVSGTRKIAAAARSLF